MSELSSDILKILYQLAPGFLAAWVLYGLTSYPKPSEFERVIHALILTFVIAAVVPLEKYVALRIGRHFQLGPWNSEAALIASMLTGLALGLVLSWLSNTDNLYAFARKLLITTRTAYPSEWYGAFVEKPLRYVVLHLTGERRILGWPRQWPSEPKSGYFMLMDAAWLDDGKQIPLDRDHAILIPVRDVEMVEFVKADEEIDHGAETAEPASSDAPGNAQGPDG